MKRLWPIVASFALAACQGEDVKVTIEVTTSSNEQTHSSEVVSSSGMTSSSHITSSSQASVSEASSSYSLAQSSSSVSSVMVGDSLSGIWVLTQVVEDTGVAKPATNLFTVKFDGVGTLALRHSCYQTYSPYSIEGDAQANAGELTVYAIPLTRNACADTLWDDFFDTMQTAESYRVHNDDLELYAPNGAWLHLRRMFDLCDTPLTIDGGDNALGLTYEPKRVGVVFAGDEPMNSLINTFETEYADWVMAGTDNCSEAINVTVHADTLARLRCDARIQSLSDSSQGVSQ